MRRNHLKVVLRHLSRHKGYTFMNVAGLAVGMVCCLFILFYVLDERSYDRYHERADQIYRVAMEQQFPDREVASALTPRSLAHVLASDYPEIVQATRLSRERTERVLVRYEDQHFFEETVFFTDPNVFDVFTLPLLRGNPETALKNPWSVVITEAMAQKYFGSEDPIGKVLSIRLRGDGDAFDYRVTGIAKEMPPQSHFRFGFLASYQLHPFATNRRDGSERQNWGGGNVYTYVVVQADASSEGLAAKITETANTYLRRQVEANTNQSFDDYLAAGNRSRYFLQPLTAIHLRSHLDAEIEPNGDAAYVYFFSAIAFFIMLLACINFVNLATARATRRAKEVGIRKVLGSHRAQLIRHYLTESLLLSGGALLVAIGLVVVLMPVFNGLTDKSLTLFWLKSEFVGFGLLVFTLVVGLAAGAYPAFLLSSFRPATVLKQGGRGGATGWSTLRSGLVVFQFAVTIGLMVSTVVMYDQMAYLLNKKLGFDEEQVVVIEGTEGLWARTEPFRQALLGLPGTLRVAHAESVPGRPLGGASPLRLEDAPPEEEVVMAWMYAGFDFVETLGLEVVAGRSLSHAFASDSTGALLNESAVQALGIDDPIGKQLVTRGNTLRYTITGVVKDFHFESLRQEITPMVIFGPDPFYSNRPRELFVARLRTDNLAETLADLQATWKAFFPVQPFRYSFLDQGFDALYRAEQTTGRLFGIFTGLALLIACLGLFGLASFTAVQRVKEIGVRKVLGASVSSIVWLLSKDFAKPVLLAFILAAPLSYFMMQGWLNDFAYRVDLSWGIFLIVGLAAFGVALLTVSYQAVKAAFTNPVESLRYE